MNACLLEYAEGSKLYLPVENIELLSKYGHEEGLLDRLGRRGVAGQEGQAQGTHPRDGRPADPDRGGARVAPAPVLEPEHHAWEEFSARFPYRKPTISFAPSRTCWTTWRQAAPMDRLICGDVGFGKTEVAMRAAFVAAMSGVQVAVIAPTTLLARQHYQSFAERFRGFR